MEFTIKKILKRIYNSKKEPKEDLKIKNKNLQQKK